MLLVELGNVVDDNDRGGIMMLAGTGPGDTNKLGETNELGAPRDTNEMPDTTGTAGSEFG